MGRHVRVFAFLLSSPTHTGALQHIHFVFRCLHCLAIEREQKFHWSYWGWFLQCRCRRRVLQRRVGTIGCWRFQSQRDAHVDTKDVASDGHDTITGTETTLDDVILLLLAARRRIACCNDRSFTLSSENPAFTMHQDTGLGFGSICWAKSMAAAANRRGSMAIGCLESFCLGDEHKRGIWVLPTMTVTTARWLFA